MRRSGCAPAWPGRPVRGGRGSGPVAHRRRPCAPPAPARGAGAPATETGARTVPARAPRANARTGRRATAGPARARRGSIAPGSMPSFQGLDVYEFLGRVGAGVQRLSVARDVDAPGHPDLVVLL